MRLTILEFDLPPGTWSGDIARRYPEITFHVEAQLPQDQDHGAILVRVRGPMDDTVLDAIRGHAAVSHVEPLGSPSPDGFLLKIVTGAPRLIQVAAKHGVVPEMPIVVQAGKATWRILGQQEGVQRLREALEAAQMPSEVRFVGELRPREELTEKQRHALLTAVKAGFYDYPRRITLRQLAKELGVASSTLSETLMVVEKKVVKHFLEDTEAPGPGRSDGPGSG